MPLPWCEKHIPSPVHVLNVFPQNCHSGEKALAIVCHLRSANALVDLPTSMSASDAAVSGDVPGAGVSNLNTAPYRAAKTLNN